MPRAPTYAQARDHLLNVLELQHWDVARTDRRGKKLKVPHATKGRARVYFKPQSMHLDCGPPFSLNAARSTHDDPRELAELVGDDSVMADKMSRTLEGRCLRENPEKHMAKMHDRPLAAKGLTSYRYRGDYGWIMIGARDEQHALSEAARSLSTGATPTIDRLEVWDSGKRRYVSVSEDTAMRLVYLKPNQAWVFLFGDSIIEMGDHGRFFETRKEAVAAAKRQGLKVDKKGRVSNPIKGMPGGSVTGCIEQNQDKDDPGAYCAAIADRIEPGWRRKSRKGKRKKNPGTVSANDLIRRLKF